ncbi:MAG TPA: M24 family metallopeptidase [Candidatus Binatia bacterium]|nr:M24 family metallopeptidase [Candidatus Binatia bacterium]
MDSNDILRAIRHEMEEQGIDLLLGFHDGAHFIEKPNAVMVLSGFKSLGHALVILPRGDESTLVVTPAWDAVRAAERCPVMRSIGADNVVTALQAYLEHHQVSPSRVATAGLAGMPWRIGEQLSAMLQGETRPMDRMVFGSARRKTPDQLSKARMATRIAEKGYERLLQIARPGMREDELAVELKWYMKTLGAEDNFLMLCAGSHNFAVQPSSGRRLEVGDIILAEITPSYMGQMAQICRTAVIGAPNEPLKHCYELVVRSMEEGIAAAVAGATMADVCRAIDWVLEAKGYGEYCRPPHIRRRGHGLGFGSNLPGDVSLDNAITLEADMFFVIHPNQYLPETGYLLCGEPVLITTNKPEILSERRATLVEIAL